MIRVSFSQVLKYRTFAPTPHMMQFYLPLLCSRLTSPFPFYFYTKRLETLFFLPVTLFHENIYLQRTRTSWTLKHNIIINAREHEKMKYVSCRLCISPQNTIVPNELLRALVCGSDEITINFNTLLLCPQMILLCYYY